MQPKSTLIDARYDATTFIDWKSESGYSGADSAKRRFLSREGAPHYGFLCAGA